LGFSIAAAFAELIEGTVDDDPGADDPDDEQPATARAAATTGPASQVARRVVLLPRSMPARLSHSTLAAVSRQGRHYYRRS
jgi:hypothetical protein